MVKNLPVMQKMRVRSLDREDLKKREWQPTPEVLPEESRRQAWWTAVRGVAKSWTRLIS